MPSLPAPLAPVADVFGRLLAAVPPVQHRALRNRLLARAAIQIQIERVERVEAAQVA